MTSRPRSLIIVLSLVLAAMTVGLVPTAAVAAPGAGDSTARNASTTTATAGETVTVTTKVTVNQSVDRMAIEESWGANVTSEAISEISFRNGTGSVLAQAVNENDGSYTVAAQSVSAGTTVVVEWELTLNESLKTGDSVTINGSVTTDGEKTNFDPLVIDVVSLESSRTASSETVNPEESVSFTVNTTTLTNVSRLSIAESVSGDIQRVTIDSVTINGSGSVLAKVADGNRVDVAVANVSSGTTVSVTYTVAVNESATGGSNVTAAGEVQYNAGTVSTGETSVEVVASVKDAVAGEDNQVDTRELQSAITSWATGQSVAGQEITTEDLSDLILTWATGGAA